MNTENLNGRETYHHRQQSFEAALKSAQKNSNRMSTLRLVTFILAAGVFVYGFYSPYALISYLSLPLLGLFFFWISNHARVKRRIDFLEKLVYINKIARQRLEGAWTSFPDSGEHHVNPDHPYTSDLNIFGKGSLFQLINATSSFLGEQILAAQLSRPAGFLELKPRQEAIADLTSRLDFRQQFQAAGMDPFFKKQDPEGVLSWAEGALFWGNRNWNAVLYLPAVTGLLFLLALTGLLSYVLPVGMLVVQAGIVLLGEKAVQQRFEETGKAVRRLGRYTGLLRWIEQEPFHAPFLVSLKQRLFPGNSPSSRHVGILTRIADRMNLRFSNALIYFPLNIALFWDLWTLKMLDDWKRRWGGSVRGWFNAVGEIEALASLAILPYDNPQWVYPDVTDGSPYIQARDLGHPLIPEKDRVVNDLALARKKRLSKWKMSNPGTVLLITGSNMSGKSTLLRTVGVNLVLAYAGAPVCASEMSCSSMGIYSKMQVQDNLELRVSTFYAELKRMKMIIDAAQSGKPLIYLLDEIFRGTNSRDRILATRTVVRQLKEMNTVGLLTTHDLELGTLEKEHPGSVFNYHFSDVIRGDRIFFDYKLKPGLSQTANAVALMKMIGIEVENGE